MNSRELLSPRHPESKTVAALIGVGLAGVATLLGLLIARDSNAIAVSLYLLAVVLAAAAGGLPGGLTGAVLASVGFTFFFTEPRFTFRIERSQDVVAAVALFAAAIVVGLLVARSVEERERAARREGEARLLGYLATKLLSAEPIDRLMDDFVSALVQPFGLERCELIAGVDDLDLHAMAGRGERAVGPEEEVAVGVGDVTLGKLVVQRPSGAAALTSSERQLLEAAARQAAAALERWRMDAEVRDARFEAETSRLRAALFSSVSHDLRTPLASIKASVTSLLDEQAHHDLAQQRELLTTVLEETDRLNRVVGNLMDLARIRAGVLTPSREPVEIDDVAASVVSRLGPVLGDVSVRLAVRPDVPEISADPVQLDQVLTNLIENAARYSPPGAEVVVSAAPFREAVQLRVTDRGPGVAPEERERVFEPFYRGDQAPERPGSGLGLAIARAVVVAHGGRIWIEGAPGGGTAVVVELPIALKETVS